MSLSLSESKSVRFLQLYYLATPLFFLVDWFFTTNIRVVIPGGSDLLNYSYYGICFIAAFLALGSDILAAFIALFECSINILLLLLSILWPIYHIGDQIAEGNTVVYNFGFIELIHFAIAGTILAIGFYQNPLVQRSK